MFISTQLGRFFVPAFLSAAALLLSFDLAAQAPIKLWDKTIGGNSYENTVKSIPTSDGGYIIAGSSASDASGDKSENSRGSFDYWVIKLNASGVKQWDKTIGGNGADYFSDIQQTSDGGYILAGSSQSGLSGDKTEGSLGQDVWIVKLSATGSIEWDNTLGGDSGEDVSEIYQTPDGGYIFAGQSFSGISGDKTEASRGSFDLWVVKLNANGSKAWDRTLGGSDYEMNASLSLTADGGCMIGGNSGSGISGDKTGGNFGHTDYWVVKLSSSGTKQWDKTFGGDNRDGLHAIVQLADGNYLIAGDSYSGVSGNKTANHVLSVSTDFWVVKIDGNGNKIWDKSYGGTSYNQLNSMSVTSDGGFVLGGLALATIPMGPFDFDYKVIKVSADGIQEWAKSFGGPEEDRLFSVRPTADRGYILAGYSESGIGPDKSQNNNGERDFWIIRLAADPLPVTLATFTATNESSTALLQWTTTSESASREFEIQHSINGKQWSKLGSVAAAGESKTDQRYQFVHHAPVSGHNNLYRLKMIDTDGTFAFSKINVLFFGTKNAGRIYPNPVTNGKLTVDVNDWELVQKVQISTIGAVNVYDSGNTRQQTIDIAGLRSGVYVLKVVKTDGTSEQYRFVR